MKIGRWLMAAALTVYATPAVAQLQYHTGLDLASSYTARGLTFTNRLVVQPSAEIAAARGGTMARLGVWANVEPAAYEGAQDLSARNGLPGATEVDVTLALAHTIGRVELGIAAIAFLYPRHERYDGGPNTVEAVFRAAVDAPLSPGFSIYYDAIAAPGIYAQLDASHEFGARTPLVLDAAVGFSHGQSDLHDPSWYYAADGFTHVELGAALPFTAGRVTVSPSVRGILAIDDEVRVISPVRQRDFKLLAGASFSWSGAVAASR